ncbi:unnamed protein product [Rhizoctonia solani]|nr:unnamed protein product [Rhizoctonia solani]
MESGAKRKRTNATNAGNQLHPGEWRNGKRSRSNSPSGSPIPSAATKGTSDSNSSALLQNLSRDSNQSQIQDCPQPTSVGFPRSAPGGTDTASIATPSNNSPSNEWTGLEKALQGLRLTTKACPPLRSAIDDLVSCVPLFETAAKNRKDYEDLAIGLKGMVRLLDPHLADTTSENITNTIKDIAEAMKKEVKSIADRQSRHGLRRVLSATNDEEDLIRRYRRIEQLFRQLYGEASLSAWSISSKHYVNTQLESLRPAKLARYNSELSMEVSRRSCTENTRTEILSNLMKWSEDRSMASIYWMNGMAGTGKTTIAYSACVALEASKQLAGSFFCTRTSSECRDAKRIVPTIAYQLARRSTPFRSALCKVLEEDTDIGTGTISAQFDQLLRIPLMEAQSTMSNNLVVVVDALDESSDPYIVKLFLGVLFRSVAGLPIKFFVTSRPEPIIRQRMMSESERSRSILYLHEIEASLVQADIELYLKEELSSIIPADKDIKQLAKYAGKLFIYAATAVRYIRPPGKPRNSRERLETVLAANVGSNRSLIPIDTLYSVILTTAIDEDEELEPQEQERMLLVLWTAVCACEPVLISTIAAISGIGSKDRVVAALEPLGSVLHISDHSELVTTLHASFPDYISSRERSGRFACDIPKHNRLLSKYCFEIMEAQLRFNICNILSSFIPDSDIPHLQDQIDANISEELFYACRFWMDHMGLTELFKTPILTTISHPLLWPLSDFLLQRLLFWMEVLNLKGYMHVGVTSTSKLNALLNQEGNAESKLGQLTSEVQDFVVGYASHPIADYTPHIYLSALPLAPFLSHLFPKFKGLIRVSGTALNKIQQAALSTWESESVVLSTAFLPKGDRIVLGKKSGELTVQYIHDGKHVFPPLKAHDGSITSLGVSHHGTQIVTGSDDMTLSVWNTHNGSLALGPFKEHTEGVTSVAFSPDGTHIISGSNDCTVGICDLHNAATPMRRFTGHTDSVNSVAFSRAGTLAISGASDRTVRLWDVFKGTALLTLDDPSGPVILAQFTPDGNSIISVSRGVENYKYFRRTSIQDVRDGSSLTSLASTGKVESISISPEGDRFVGSVNGSIGISDIPMCLEPIAASTGKVASISISPEGDQFVGSASGSTLGISDIPMYLEPIAGPFHGHTSQLTSTKFSDDGTRVISASNDRTVRVWNVHRKVRQLEPKDTPKVPRRLDPILGTISANQTSIATSDPTNIHVFNLDLHTSTHIASPSVILIKFSLDATRIFSIHASGTVCTWNADTAQLIDGPCRCSNSNRFESVACSVDGTHIATSYYDTVEIWDAQSNHIITIRGLGTPKRTGNTLVFSWAGTKILTVGHDVHNTNGWDVLNIWDTNRGTLVAGPIEVPGLQLGTFDLSADGTYVACSSKVAQIDNGLRLINTITGETNFMPSWNLLIKHCVCPHVLARFSFDGRYVAFTIGSSCYVWNTQDQTVIAVLVIHGTRFQSISYNPNGWFLAISNTSIPGSDFVQAWRFDINKPLSAIRSDGWIVNELSQPLFWVPAEIRTEFPKSIGMNISGESSLFVDYSGMLSGDDWRRCYIGG